jgi:hypothetical protein
MEEAANLRFRERVYKAAEGNELVQALLWEMCRKDIVFYAASMVWQVNPNAIKGEKDVGPFIPWPYQIKAIRTILSGVENRKDKKWPKSRETGASWVNLIIDDWLCRFYDHKEVITMSRDEASVDKPQDRSSLFGKLDFLQEFLPDWLDGQASGMVERRHLSFHYLRTSSSNHGTTSTTKAGVGSRATKMTIDEFGEFEGDKGQGVFDATRDTSHCRIFVGTHKSTDAFFNTLCYDPKHADIERIDAHWSQHPHKNRGLYRYNEGKNEIEYLDPNFHSGKYHYPPDFVPLKTSEPLGGPFPGLRSPWYDAECKGRTERGVRMNLDIDPQGASSLAYSPFFIRTLQSKYASDPLWTGSLLYTKKGQPVELIEKADGPIRMWVHPKGKCEVPLMKCGGGVDHSLGMGHSPTCVSFANMQTGQKVMEFVSNKIKPIPSAALIHALCVLFHNVKLAWEIPGPGLTFGEAFLELGYRNVWVRPSSVDSLYQSGSGQMKVGWVANKANKRDLHEQYCSALESRRFLNPSRWALEECLNFVYADGTVEYKNRGVVDQSDDNVFHGDIVVADALAYLVIKDEIQDAQEQSKKIEDELKKMQTLQHRMWLHQQEEVEEEVWC